MRIAFNQCPMYVFARSHAEIRTSSQVLIALLTGTESLPIIKSIDRTIENATLSVVKEPQHHYRSTSMLHCWHTTFRVDLSTPSFVHQTQIRWTLIRRTKHIVSQKPNDLRSISFGYLRRLRRLVLFTYGSFWATQSNSSTLCPRHLTVHSLISIFFKFECDSTSWFSSVKF